MQRYSITICFAKQMLLIIIISNAYKSYMANGITSHYISTLLINNICFTKPVLEMEILILGQWVPVGRGVLGLGSLA